jgi:hypothetical protein
MYHSIMYSEKLQQVLRKTASFLLDLGKSEYVCSQTLTAVWFMWYQVMH